MNSYHNKIIINKVSKSFNDFKVLKDISINVKEGELVSILGPSGSGKSTLFNILSGLSKPDNGEVVVNGHLSYMYQKDMMLPWKKVIDNISLPLVINGKRKKEARDYVKEYIKNFGLEGFEYEYPHKLSGGMKQRANFLKTYLTSKDIMLLDEPFGALDSITRSKMQKWLLDIRKNVNSTILFITHDIEEAIFISDRIYIISEKPAVIKGEIIVDIPKERNQATLTCDKFLELKADIIKYLEV